MHHFRRPWNQKGANGEGVIEGLTRNPILSHLSILRNLCSQRNNEHIASSLHLLEMMTTRIKRYEEHVSITTYSIFVKYVTNTFMWSTSVDFVITNGWSIRELVH